MSAGDRELPLEPEASTSIESKKNKKKFDYNAYLKRDFGEIIDLLELTELQKRFLRSRWLDQLMWMENRAATSRNWHRYLQLTTVLGGVLVPALVSLSSFNPELLVIQNSRPAENSTFRGWIGVSAFVLSQIVAISAASEQFFKNGDRWRHYRRSAESLKTQGWQYFELSGPYVNYAKTGGHKEAFALFASNVEEVIQHDVEVYSTKVIQEKKKEEEHEQPET